VRADLFTTKHTKEGHDTHIFTYDDTFLNARFLLYSLLTSTAMSAQHAKYFTRVNGIGQSNGLHVRFKSQKNITKIVVYTSWMLHQFETVQPSSSRVTRLSRQWSSIRNSLSFRLLLDSDLLLLQLLKLPLFLLLLLVLVRCDVPAPPCASPLCRFIVCIVLNVLTVHLGIKP